MNNSDISEDKIGEENEALAELEDEQNVPLRRTTRINAGKGVERTHPCMQFTMKGK